MSEAFDPRKSATAFDQASTLVVVLELSGKSWRAGAIAPGRGIFDYPPESVAETKRQFNRRLIRQLKASAFYV